MSKDVEFNRGFTGLYSIRDRLEGALGHVMEAKNDDVAVRNFQAVMEKNSYDWSEFELLRVGFRDDDRIYEHETPFLVLSGSALISRTKVRLEDEKPREI